MIGFDKRLWLKWWGNWGNISESLEAKMLVLALTYGLLIVLIYDLGKGI